MGGEGTDRWHDLGAFIRDQRNTARLSLRRLSELAGISNPYLSQIERGLRRPSAEILQQIARALRISAETLYVQAGILDRPPGPSDLLRHIAADPDLTGEQKQALTRIYLSFRREAGAPAVEVPPEHGPGAGATNGEAAGGNSGNRGNRGDRGAPGRGPGGTNGHGPGQGMSREG
jgi:transcriptional regulator with XRE-family HTH domain